MVQYQSEETTIGLSDHYEVDRGGMESYPQLNLDVKPFLSF